MRTYTLIAVIWLAVTIATHGEQIRVAVTVPVVVGETNGVGGQAALWQSLVVAELSRHDWFAQVDREDLPLAAQEWALAAANANSSNVPATHGWQGADLLVIGRFSVSNGQCMITAKVLDAQRGTIEDTVTEAFPLAEFETRAKTFANRLQPLALRWLARRDIHTLASVLDFDLQGTLDRSRWTERAAARRLRGFLQQQPGLLVLEREQVEELLAETRLRRGGLTAAGIANTNGWAHLRHYQLISGTVTETQPEGQPPTFRVQTRLRDLDAGGTNEFTESFPASQWQEGMGHIEWQLRKVLVDGGNSGGAKQTNGVVDRSSEALDLFARALKLTGIWEFSTPDTFQEFCSDGLLWDNALYTAFGESRIPMRGVPIRRAKILRAVQYLEAALLADNSDPKAKLLLASLLVDPDVNDRALAVQLAEEVGWQHPERRFAAWSHAYAYSSGDLQQRYLKLLIQYFPKSHFASLPAYAELGVFLDKHRNDPDLTAVVDAMRPFIEREISDTRGDLIEGFVKRLFDYTQITGRNPLNKQRGYELQSPKNRARGVALLEDMLSRHPDKAFFICHFWSYYWDYYTDSDADIRHWLKRAAGAAPHDPKDRWNMSVWWDKPRIELARRLMGSGEFGAAIPYLEKISNGHLERERDLRLGRCEFETGDYERALKLFRAFGLDHKEASEWAAKCEKEMGLPPLTLPTKPYRTTTNHAPWKVASVAFPQVKGFAVTSGQNGLREFVTNKFSGRIEISQSPGDVWAMAADADNIWLGLVCPVVWADYNLLMLEREPVAKANALRQGGLLRWNRITGQTRFYSVEDGLPHPWVSALADSPEGLWVGTLGGGIGLLDKRTGHWRVWSETNGLPLNSVRSLCVDGNAVWAGFGHLERGAVARYSNPTGQWRVMLPGDFSAQTNYPPQAILSAPGVPPFMKEPRIVSHVPVSLVSALAVIEDRLWCALPGERRGPVNDRFQPRGTVLLDLKSKQWLPVSGMAASGYVRWKDRVWMSLGVGGLAHCDLRGGDWQLVTRAEGLAFDPGIIIEWQGRLLISGEQFTVFDPEEKRFEVLPFPTPGGAGLMSVAGNTVYLVRGNQILSLDLATLAKPNPAAAPPPR